LVRPEQISEQSLAHDSWFHRVFTCLLLLLSSEMAFCQIIPSTLNTNTVFNFQLNQLDFKVTASFPEASAWSLERSQGKNPDQSSGGNWFPIMTGTGSVIPARYQEMILGAPSNVGFDALLQSFPLFPTPGPPPGSIGYRRMPQFQYFHATLRFQHTPGSNSKVYATWSSHNTPAASFTTSFEQTELDLRDPLNPNANRYPFGVGSITGLLTDTPPIFMSYSIFPLVEGEAIPTLSLSPNNEGVFRQFIVNHQEAIRAEMWPENTGATYTPSAVSMDQRSFYRLRTSPAPVMNSHGIPNGLATWWAAFNGGVKRLMISEVCFSRTAVLRKPTDPFDVNDTTHLVGGEAADWVEIWNPNDITISTTGYSLSKSGSTLGFPLPAVDLAPGAFLLIHCSAKGNAKLVADGGANSQPAPPTLTWMTAVKRYI
jgi:hypothetical protein